MQRIMIVFAIYLIGVILFWCTFLHNRIKTDKDAGKDCCKVSIYELSTCLIASVLSFAAVIVFLLLKYGDKTITLCKFKNNE